MALALLSSVAFARGDERLVLLGGGPRPAEALARFVEWAGREHSRILVIPWGAQEPQAAFDSLRRELAPHRPGAVGSAPLSPLSPSEKDELLAQLGRATGAFFVGGDQGGILDALKDASLRDALRSRYHEGMVIGASSAGTACMSGITITGEGDFAVIDGNKVEVRAGLGLLPGVLLDQHFITRQRENRLFGLVLEHPRLLGVGLDEGAALLVRGNRHAEVVGASRVVAIEARAGGELRLHLLSPGETFDLKKRKRGTPADRR